MKNQLLLPVLTLFLFSTLNLTAQELAFTAVKHQMQTLLGEREEDISWGLIHSFHRLVEFQLENNDTEEALTYCLRAQKMADKLGRSNYQEVTQNYKYLVQIYMQIGDYAKGMAYAEAGLEFTLSHPQWKEADIVSYHLKLGRMLMAINESKRAIEHLQKALYLIENGRNVDYYISNNDLPVIYRMMGSNYFNIQDLENASFYFKKCLSLFTEQEDKVAINLTIANILSIGCIYIQEQEYEQALQYLSQADSLIHATQAKFENADFLFHQFRGIRWQYGTIWMELGKLEEAKKNFLEIAEKYPMKGQEWEDAGTYYRLSMVYEWSGDLEKALYYNHQGILASCKTFDDPSYFALPAYDDFRELGNTYWLLNQKAKYLALLASSEIDPVLKAQYYTIALRVIELFDQLHHYKLRKKNVLRDGYSQTLVATSLMNYRTGLSIAQEYYEWNNLEESLEKAFVYAQKMKAQQLRLTLLKNNAVHLDNIPAPILEREKKLLAEIQVFEEKIMEARQKKDTALIAMYENDFLFGSRRAYTALVQEIEQNYPEYYQAKYRFVPENDKSLQRILKKKELLVEYIFADDALFIFTISRNQPLELTKVTLQANTAAQVNKFNDLLQRSFFMRHTSRGKFIELNYELYQQFIRPIEDKMEGNDRLIIIGDGMTHYIPFEALVSSGEVKPFRELDYLIKKYEVSYHYSASIFADVRLQNKLQKSGIFSFAPVYEKTEALPRLLAADRHLNNDSNKFRAFANDGTFKPLPESEREVKSIAKLFPNKENLLALRQMANESNLKSNLEKPYQFIHIAGHSFADLENPKFSGIACFGDTVGMEQAEDGILYTGEIYNLDIKADLVTLSSCESGFGRLENAEGLSGLNRAFIYAGTPNVVFSLWKVYDKVSAALMVDFYKQILSGKSYASSLREAKLKLLEEDATAAPHFWSPYLLIGR